MKFLYFAVSAVVILVSVLFFQNVTDGVSEPCPDVAVYGTAGSGAGGTASPPAELVAELAKRRNLIVDLEANPYPGSQENDQDYLRSVGMGQANLLKWISEFQTRCSDAAILLVGFSQGAHVTHEALTRLRSTANVHALLIADPIRNGEDPAIEDYLIGDGPSGPYGDFLVRNGYEANPLDPKLSGVALSLCHSNDIVCNAGGEHEPDAHLRGFTEAKPRIAQWVEEVLS